MIGTVRSTLFFQAEVVGKSVGDGIMQLILMVLIGVGAIVAFVAFLWFVRKVDKKINK